MGKTNVVTKDSNDVVRYLILGISTVVIVIFFARFCAKTNTLSVTFDGYLSSSTVIVNKDGTINEPSTPTRDGYIFKGWYLNGKPFDFSTKITKNITLEAVWEKAPEKDTYTVTFITGDESFSKEVKSNSLVEEPVCEVYDSNTCKGWYLGDTLYDFSTPITSDIVLEARYEFNGEAHGGDIEDDTKSNPNNNSNKKNNNNNSNNNNKEDKDKEAPKSFTPILSITTNKVVVTGSTTDNKTSEDKLVYTYSLDGKNYQSSNTFNNLSNNKEYTVYVKVTDEAGNSTVVRRTFTTDKVEKPEVGSISNTNPTTDDVVINVTNSEYPMYYSLDGGNTWNQVDGGITVTSNTNVLVKATDGVSDSEILTIPVNNIDREAPNEYEPTINKTSKSIEVTGTTTDNGGGEVTYQYKLNDGEYIGGNTFTNLTTGTYTVTIRVTDELGNSREITKTVEVLPPSTPEVSLSNSNLTNQDVTVTVTNVGDYTVECYDGNSYNTCDSTRVFTENGSVTYRFTDGINTGESKEVVVNNIDKVAPEAFTITVSNQTTRSLTVNGSTTDNVSSTLEYSYGVDDANYQSSNEVDKITTGDHTIYCKAKDEAGNETVAMIDVTMAALPSVTLGADRTNITNQDVIVSVNNPSEFATEYALNDGEYTSVPDGNSIVIEHNALVKVRTTDGFNNGPVAELDITNIDKEAPVVHSLGITHTTRQIFFDVDATDDRNGSLTYQYQKNDEGFRNYSNFGYFTSGTYTMSVKVIDEAGNETIASEEVVLEPLQVPNMSVNHTTWTNETIRFELSDEHKAYKSANSLTLQFSLDGGSYGTSGNTYQMGNGTIRFRFTDGTNTGEYAEFVVDYYDPVPPSDLVTSYTKTTNRIEMTASGTDDKTEVTYKYSIDGGTQQDSNIFTGVTTGNHYVDTYAYDLAGNYTQNRDNIVIDAVPVPEITSSNTSLTNQSVTLTCSNTGIFTLQYSADGTNYTEINNSVVVDTNGTYRFRLYDGVNYSELNNFVVSNIDKEAPEITGRDYTKTTRSVTMNYTATDNMSTTLVYEYRVDNSIFDSSNVIDSLHTGNHSITVKVTDEAGNSVEEVVNVEIEPIPAPTYAINPSVPTKDDVIATITNPSVFSIEIKDGDNFVPSSNTITFTDNGSKDVRFTDGINYSEATTVTVNNIDKIAPYEFVPDTVLTTSTITINASTTDNLSTTITYQYRLDDADYQNNNVYTFVGLGNHTIYVKATDEVGNERIVSKEVELIDIPLPTVSYARYQGDWINETETATVTNKGDYTVEYKFNDGEFTSINGDSFDIEENAMIFVRLSNGTHYSDSYYYNLTYIDKVNPYINGLSITDKTSYSMTVNVDGGDDLSGISYYIYEFDDGIVPVSLPYRTYTDLSPDTEYTFKVTARDRAGNTYTETITERTASASNLFSIYSIGAESDEGINFNDTSSNINGRGVYKTSNNIYYYRGEVDNYVLLGDMCFNIVRSTESNGTKLIYSGPATNGTCGNTGAAATIGSYKFSSKEKPFVNDVNYMTNDMTYKYMDLSSQSTSIRYASSYTYENGVYTLVNPISSSDWSNDPDYDFVVIGVNYKYTCFSGDTCSTLNYIVDTSIETGAHYIELANGESLDTIKNNLFNNANTNSNVKNVLDTWYQNNMTSYADLLEDAKYCNDKRVIDWGFLNPDSNNYSNNGLIFDHNLTFTCDNADAYTVGSSGNGKLTYPVGLLTSDEYIYAGGNFNPSANTDSYLNIGVTQYTMTPSDTIFNQGTGYADILTFGSYLDYAPSNEELYIRPVITLNSDALVARGTGTSSNPFVIVTS